MAARTAWRTSVLDDADDQTAQLIVQMQVDDMRSLADNKFNTNDSQAAHQIYHTELNHYCTTRGFQTTQDPDPDFEAAVLPRRVFCEACLAPSVENAIYRAPCGHPYCDDCLQTIFRNSMADPRFYPPSCCRRTVPFEIVKPVLGEELAHDFATAKPEMDDDKKAYCHVPACSTYIPNDKRMCELGQCPKCEADTCLVCKSASHAGKDCPEDEGVKSLEALAQEKGWKRCPTCQRMVELRTGCHHMT